MSHDEQALWQRVEAAVQRQPGPDQAKLAGIHARLDTRRSSGRRHLWLAAALAAALGTTAVAALWLQSEPGPEPAADAQDGPDEANINDVTPTDLGEPMVESSPAEPQDNDDPSDPVIFRE